MSFNSKIVRYYFLMMIALFVILGSSNFSSNKNGSLLFSQENNKVVAEQKVDFYLDYATFFKGALGKSFVEVYIAIPMKSLTYNENLNGSFSVSVQVFNKDNKVIAEDYWGQKVKIENEEQKYSTSEFPAITKFNIEPGIYRLLVEVKDLSSGKSAEIDVSISSEKFIVEDFYSKIYEDKAVTISSVQLCSKLVRLNKNKKDELDRKKSDFEKNGHDVLPNPRKLYGTFRPFMEYMVELYGIEKGKKYYMKWHINDSEGNTVLKSEYKEKKAPGTTMALTGRVKVHSLKTGSYYFKLLVTENPNAIDEEDVITSTVNNFFIFRKIDFTQGKNKLATQELLLQERKAAEKEKSLGGGTEELADFDYMITLNDKQVIREFKIIETALLSTVEKKLTSKLNIDGKRNYLNQFWNQKDKLKQGSRNIFLSAVKQVNNKYSTGNKKGWETDRGRVYLKVGKPDTQDIVLSNQNQLDHEIWKYFKDNYTFVFLDKHGLTDFRLIHSNYEGEKYDPRWKDKLEKKLIGF